MAKILIGAKAKVTYTLNDKNKTITGILLGNVDLSENNHFLVVDSKKKEFLINMNEVILIQVLNAKEFKPKGEGVEVS